MPKANAAVKFDVDGSEIMSKVLMELLNTCPALCGRKITFSTLGEDDGLAFFPSVGAAVTSEKESITGHVNQVCAYPFDIVLRCAPKTEAARMRSKELLDATTPEAAVISVGEENSYGHPGQATLDRLKERNIAVYRTDLEGTITIQED